MRFQEDNITTRFDFACYLDGAKFFEIEQIIKNRKSKKTLLENFEWVTHHSILICVNATEQTKPFFFFF